MTDHACPAAVTISVGPEGMSATWEEGQQCVALKAMCSAVAVIIDHHDDAALQHHECEKSRRQADLNDRAKQSDRDNFDEQLRRQRATDEAELDRLRDLGHVVLNHKRDETEIEKSALRARVEAAVCATTGRSPFNCC